MSQVHYKFQSSNEHDSITFDGLSISLSDLRSAILSKQKLAQSDDFTLQITNAQTKDVYKNESDLIPKNSSVTVTRVPIAKVFKGQEDSENMNEDSHLAYLAKRAENTVSMAEEETIKAMMNESSNTYDASNYTVRPRFQPKAVPPSHYVCNRCGQKGHYISNCPQYVPHGLGIGMNPLVPRIPRPRIAHGIPNSYLVPAEKNTPGAVWTKFGYAINAKDAEAYEAAMKKKTRAEEVAIPEFDIPENFICPICNEIMKDAVKTSCCATHFCDSCIRTALMDDEDQTCPKCNEVDVSPDSLMPDILLRSAISTFLNKTKTGVRRTKKTANKTGNDSPALPGLAERSGVASTEAIASPRRDGTPQHSSPSLNMPNSSLTPERSQTPNQLLSAAGSSQTGSKSPDPHSLPNSQLTSSNSQDSKNLAHSQTTTSTQNTQQSGEGSQSTQGSVPMDMSQNSSHSTNTSLAAASSAASTQSSTSSTATMLPVNPALVNGPPGVTPATSTMLVTSAAHLAHPGTGLMAPAASMSAVYPTPGFPVAGVASAPYHLGVFRPTTVVPGTVPYQQFPPGMRPGLNHVYPTTSMASTAAPAAPFATHPYQMGGKILSKEEFYKVKSELLEKQIKEKEAKKDPLMDAFGDIFSTQARPRIRSPSRSRSRTPMSRRPYSRSPGRRRSYSRSPTRRGRSPSPRYYRRSRTPTRRYYSRSPPPYKDYYRGRSPSRYYGSGRGSRHPDEYYRSSYEPYRKDRYHNGDRYSPHDRYRDERDMRYTPPLPSSNRYTPPLSSSRYSPRDRKEYYDRSPRDRRPDGYSDEYRRHYEDDHRRTEDDYRRYEEEKLKYRDARYPEDYDQERRRYADEERAARTDEDDYEKRRGGSVRAGSAPVDDKRKEHSRDEHEKSGEKEKKAKRTKRESSHERVDNDTADLASDTKDEEPKKEKSSSSKTKEKKRKRRGSRDDKERSHRDGHRDGHSGYQEDNTTDLPSPKKKSRHDKEVDSKAVSSAESPEKPSAATDPTISKTEIDAEKSTSKTSHKKKSKRDGKTKTKSGEKSSSSKTKGEKKKKSKSSSDKKSSKSSKIDADSSDVKKSGDPAQIEASKSSSKTDEDNKENDGTQSTAANSQASSVSGDDNQTKQQQTDALEEGEASDHSSDSDNLAPVIQAPAPSKWEREDYSENDSSRQQSPKRNVKPQEQQTTLSRKVLESAESLIRNKALQPQTGSKRKVQVDYSSSAGSSSAKRAANDTDSDDSDKKSDLRKKLEKIKQRKYSSSDMSSSETYKTEGGNPRSKNNSNNVSKVSVKHDKAEERRSSESDKPAAGKLDLRRISEEHFEPDYDIDLPEKSPEPAVIKDQSPVSKSASESESDNQSSDEERRRKKKQKKKSSSTKDGSKHKKHKRHSKKSKKHKKSDK